MAFLGELQAKGVDLYLHAQGLDTSTPAGRVMFQMLGVFSEFERSDLPRRFTTGSVVRTPFVLPSSATGGGAIWGSSVVTARITSRVEVH